MLNSKSAFVLSFYGLYLGQYFSYNCDSAVVAPLMQ